MDNTGRMAPAAVGLALLLGILGNLLIIHSDGMGLGPALWVAALVAGTMGLARWTLGRDGLQGDGRWLLAGAVVFAAGLVWRASPLLHSLDILAIGLCLGLAALTLRDGSLSRAGVLSYPLWLAFSAIHHAIGPFLLLFSDVQWKELPKSGWSRHAGAVLRGLLIAVPLLLVFGGLFAAADAVFAELMGRVFTFDGEALFEHLFGTLFFGALAAGFLRTGLIREREALPRMGGRGGIALGAVETGVVLGLLNLLFLAFVLVQVRYLFGGAELVLASAHLTYAEYARSGFFELVQVTVLVLPVLLALHWALPEENEAAHRLYRWLGVPLVGLLFVIMASAMQRMRLYVMEYGLTELRLYTTAFMVWMAFLFVWFLATVVRGQRDRFAVGALAGGLAVLLLLHAVNPGALIARTNVALAPRTGRFDAAYAASLGPDAVPVLVGALDTLPEAARQELVRELALRYDQPSSDWRAWNWGRARAYRLLSSLEAE
ncbi:DUF4153 domain-containing protein [Symbiobacterium terraclitae]|uniref:DUF4153 domain-containing protein n=1 Tax=Symbiobacterium terraclitae TaxID=557451 RepID=UPI0035B4FCFE